LSFSRAFTDAAGKSDMASFKLAFASSVGSTDAFLFAVERINAPKIDRRALQAHGNGVTGIAEIVAVSDAPSEQRNLISAATGLEQSATFDLPNATLTVLDPRAFTLRFRLAVGEPSDLRFAAIVFSVRSADATASLLAHNSIEHDIAGNEIVVQPASGQGAAFIFREIT